MVMGTSAAHSDSGSKPEAGDEIQKARAAHRDIDWYEALIRSLARWICLMIPLWNSAREVAPSPS